MNNIIKFIKKYGGNKMKAAYLKAPYMFEVRDVELREIKDTEVIVDVKACGFW